ncbi:MAG: Tat proofreading chaperone DmsD [Anaerolineae bacterium]|nr:Tat proofreading chaperone DmsD [Anaerolineae bacterium]
MTDPQTIAQLKAMRDFFVARNAAELAAAYTYLADWVSQPAPAVTDWQAVEFGFNRLFVGPKAPLAPPFASVYLEPEPQLMGQSTLHVRQIYQLVGLESPWKNVIPEDHIGFELDAYRQLRVAAQQVQSHELHALLNYFLTRHLNIWLPRFARRVKTAAAVPAAINFVVDCLAAWLTHELSTNRLSHVSLIEQYQEEKV